MRMNRKTQKKIASIIIIVLIAAMVIVPLASYLLY